MDKYIDRFPEQLIEALAIGEQISEINAERPITNILISGMGGSGIGGAIVQEFVADKLNIPVLIVNDYDLPVFAAENTLFICCSYSGNTEETLSTFHQALEKKCFVVCITTGGKLKELAEINKFPTVIIPGGMPPRTCLGYSLVAQLYVLYKMSLIGDDFITQIKRAADLLLKLEEEIKITAKSTAEKIKDTIPIIYSSTPLQNVGLRLKQQINENAKMHCFANVIPEMNHNELVAYYERNTNLSVIYLRDKSASKQINKRFDLCAELIRPKVLVMEEFYAEGTTHFEKLLYLVHIGDWLSYYLSELNLVDAIKIQSLDWLKTELEN